MQQVSSEWKNNQRQPVVGESMIEVSLGVTDPDASEDASSSDNGHVYFANTGQVVQGIDKHIEPYTTLERNLWVLDGSKRPLPLSNHGDTGYIGDVLSDSNGRFSKTPILDISFTRVHTNLLPGIVIEWDVAHGDFAVDFKVTAYNGSSTVATVTVNGNKEIYREVYMDISNYDRISIEILKWSSPYRRARIANINLGHSIRYENKNFFMRFEHSQEIDPLGSRLPKMGLKFSVDNRDNQYNPYNEGGYTKYLIERQEIKVRYGFKLGNDVEWIDGGIFYLSGWDAPQNGLMANFEARDILEFMRGTYMKGKYYPEGISLKSLAEDVLQDAQLPQREDGLPNWQIDNSLNNIYTTAPLPVVSHAECLQMIANAGGCTLYVDRQGLLRIEPLGVETTDYEINDFNSYTRPEVSLSKPLLQVDVAMYSYFTGEDVVEVYKGDLLVEGESTFTVSYSNPTVNPIASVSGGTLVSAVYYTNACELTIAGNGIVSVVIEGKVLNQSETIITTPSGDKGEIQQVKNKLITSPERAKAVGMWVQEYLSRRGIVTLNWRADPRVDVGDKVLVQNRFGMSPLRLTRTVFTYNGGFRGRGEGRDLSEMV